MRPLPCIVTVYAVLRLLAAFRDRALPGCARDFAAAIVATRDHQGDAAFANRNYADAALA